MRIAAFTMIGQFPDGIGLHARNLRWALSRQDHIFIVTFSTFITNYGLQNDDRTTYIEFGECGETPRFVPFWKEFPRIVGEHRIDPEWFLFMEQDIWFTEKIEEDPLPATTEIRSHLPLHTGYHAVTIDEQLYHPRIWEGSLLINGPLVQRAIDFGIDFSAHTNWFIKKDKEYWDQQAGGAVSFREYEKQDTMDEFTLYCALVEKTKVTHCPKAVHLQGPEALHRISPETYRHSEEEKLRGLSDQWNWYFCIHLAVAIYFIAGNWKREADWKRIQRRYKPTFEKLIRTAKEWMKPDEYERLEKIVTVL